MNIRFENLILRIHPSNSTYCWYAEIIMLDKHINKTGALLKKKMLKRKQELKGNDKEWSLAEVIITSLGGETVIRICK